MTKLDLWDFQAEDVDKLAPKAARLDASEMGTGKTYKGIELDLRMREAFPKGKTLLVAPLSVLDVWDTHFTELTDLRFLTINPKLRDASWNQFVKQDWDVFGVHWDVLRLMPELQQANWMHVIADEVHRAQNRKVQQTRALKAIKRVEAKTGLSGTPTTGYPDKLWSVLNWLYPHIYRSYWKFYKEFVEFEIVYPQGFHKITGPKNEEKLLHMMEPWYVRHLKREQCCPHHPLGVTPNLPDKYYSQIWVDLHPAQRKAYQQMKKELIAWVGTQEDKPLIAPVVIAQLIRLQQFAVAHADIESDGSVRLAEPSSKLDALMDLIADNPSKQIVVFSASKQAIYLLANRLQRKGISHGLITGDQSEPERADAVRAFQKGDLHVMAGTIRAGGVGITLHAASTVVFLDRDWSPAYNKQAEDRLDRIGQKNEVQVIDIMARDTIDLGRHQRLEQMWGWVKRLLGD